MSAYYQNLRQVFISDSLHIYGYIGRAHLERKFGISPAQASIDINVFKENNPGRMGYEPKLKAYLDLEFSWRLVRLVQLPDAEDSQ